MGNASYGIGRHRLLQTRNIRAFFVFVHSRPFTRSDRGADKRVYTSGNEVPRMKEVIVDFDVSCRVMEVRTLRPLLSG